MPLSLSPAGCHESLPLNASDVFEVARALPYFRLVSVVPRLRSIFETVGDISAMVSRFAVVYLAISYAFAVIGMAILGGVDQSDNNGYCQQCQMYTFQSFSKTWLALLQLTVGNNWNSILYPNVCQHLTADAHAPATAILALPPLAPSAAEGRGQPVGRLVLHRLSLLHDRRAHERD